MNLKKRRKANGKCNGLDPDQPLTESEAVEYARHRGFRLTRDKLAQSRMNPPRCPGPKFRRIDGRWIEYTVRFLEEYFEARKPQVIDPAKRRQREVQA